MTAETHACCSDPPGACWQREEVIDRLVRILIVGFERLDCLPFVALVGSRDIVGERLGAGEVVVAAWGGDDIPLTRDLPGEPSYRAGDCGSVLVGPNHIRDRNAVTGPW